MKAVVVEKLQFYGSQVPAAMKSAMVELALFLLMISNLGIYTICEDLALEKACRVNLNFSQEICNSIIKNRNDSMASEEAEIQKLVSTVKSAHAIVDYGVPIILMMFLGPLSDVFGRKVPMLLCVGGYLLQYSGAMLSAYMTSWGLWTFKFILSTTRAFGGGEAAYNMAAMSYISDVTPTSPALRTVRTGVLYSFFIAGVPVGSAYGAKLSSLNLGYVKSLALASCPGFLAFLLVVCFVQNTRNAEKASQINQMTRCQILTFIFNPKSTWIQIFKTLTKKRDGYNRLNIFAVLFSQFCVMAPMSAEFTVRYLFLRIQLNWNLVEFGNFSTFSYVVGILGVILSMGILSYFFKLSDPVVGFISGFSQFASCFLYTFATTSFLMYLAPVIDMMNGTMVVVNKSILSKFVTQDEVGNLFGFVGVVDSISPLILVPIYNIVYKATFESLPGTFYLLSAALTIPAFIVFAWLISCDLKQGTGLFQPKSPTSHNGIYITNL